MISNRVLVDAMNHLLAKIDKLALNEKTIVDQQNEIAKQEKLIENFKERNNELRKENSKFIGEAHQQLKLEQDCVTHWQDQHSRLAAVLADLRRDKEKWSEQAVFYCDRSQKLDYIQKELQLQKNDLERKLTVATDLALAMAAKRDKALKQVNHFVTGGKLKQVIKLQEIIKNQQDEITKLKGH